MAAKIDKIKLAEMANGALQELFENDLGKVVNNINDPNTSAKKARKISFELKFVPLDEKRELVNVSITTKTTLAPAEGITTNMIISSKDGAPVVVEYGNQLPGQMNFSDFENEEQVEESPYRSNILNFRAAK